MPSSTCHLPNGLLFSVKPVFGGVTFKETDAGVHNTALPPGWTVVIHTEKPVEDGQADGEHAHDNDGEITTPTHTPDTPGTPDRKVRLASFKKPTLQDDCIFISSINSPSDSDYKTPISPSRQIAMMLWATLWWYFHEPQPDPRVVTEASALTSELGRPQREWRVNIKREGIFKGKNLLQKLERMGLISNEDSSVGTESIEVRNPANWARMFTSRRSFWQLDPRMFIFTLTPTNAASFSPLTTPYDSRPTSPSVESLRLVDGHPMSPAVESSPTPSNIFSSIGGPYHSGSHLPTFYPPAPTQYIFTNGIRHPLRQRPPHQGETFYTRYIPSVGQYLSFRVPVLNAASSAATPSSSLTVPPSHTSALQGPSDVDLLNKWMNNPRVNAAWGEAGPRSKTEEFLKHCLNDRHSFPVFGCWDGKPFGFFEIYWVKEDPLGRLLNSVSNYDRGLHVLVGEEEFRGAHRLHVWISSLVHYCWLAEPRTEAVLLEPRVDNKK
jgi:N5-hydroxyornithine acetyltransferase